MQISVEVDLDDVIDALDDLDDKELAAHGLMRIAGASPAAKVWHDVQNALRQRDQRRLDDLLCSMAWDQAGVILPVGKDDAGGALA